MSGKNYSKVFHLLRFFWKSNLERNRAAPLTQCRYLFQDDDIFQLLELLSNVLETHRQFHGGDVLPPLGFTTMEEESQILVKFISYYNTSSGSECSGQGLAGVKFQKLKVEWFLDAIASQEETHVTRAVQLIQ